MSNTPTTDGLSADARALLGAVLEALDLPHAATAAHDETRTKILAERVMHLTVALQLVSERGDVGFLDWLRDKLAEHPSPGYVTVEQARERCEAGATWRDAVRLDYPAVQAAR